MMSDGVMVAGKAIDGLPHQVKFWKDTRNDWQIGLVAALGQGKSFGLLIKCALLAEANVGLNGLLVVPNFPMFKRVHLAEWPHLAKTILGINLTYHRGDNYFNWPSWGKTWVSSASNPETMAGSNVAYALWDEPGQQNERAHQRGAERARHPDAKVRQKCLGGTPEGINWYAEHHDVPDASKQRATIRGYTWHPRMAHYPKELKSLYGHSQPLLDTYAKALFVPLQEGRVYAAFNRHIHVDDELAQYTEGLPLILGCDFNVDGMTWEVLQIGPDWINYIHEIPLKANGTTQEACEAFFDAFPPSRHPGEVIICGDAAGNARSTAATTDYSTIRTAFSGQDYSSFRLRVPKANPKQKDRANNTNYHMARLAAGAKRVRVHSSCDRLVKDFERVTWKHSMGVHSIDKKDPKLTHPSDAATYPLWELARAKTDGLAVTAEGAPRASAPEVLTGMRM